MVLFKCILYAIWSNGPNFFSLKYRRNYTTLDSFRPSLFPPVFSRHLPALWRVLSGGLSYVATNKKRKGLWVESSAEEESLDQKSTTFKFVWISTFWVILNHWGLGVVKKASINFPNTLLTTV